MSVALSSKLPTVRRSHLIYAAIALVAAVIVVSIFHRKPRPWPIAEVPIAFWAWRTESPAQVDVRDAIDKAHAQTIFLRAGQIDLQDGKLRRIRPVHGLLPQAIDLQLVYNSTRSLLTHFENIDEDALAIAIAQAFRKDSERASQVHAHVIGLQVDIDVPTRLLRRYRRTLTALRSRLPQSTQLAITGLPTWMDSPELYDVLEVVDFWVPQFYGAEIPERPDQLIPISSAHAIRRDVIRARNLGKPFYAGLATYNCALLYSSSGSLISLRGDMDPTLIAADPNLELIDQRSLDSPAVKPNASAAIDTDWRYAYRARADGVTDGLALHAGDVLVIEVPSAESLRTAARIVRELAGEKLRGICVFRLPARDDPATLTVEQVASALADHDSAPLIDIRINRDKRRLSLTSYSYNLELRNLGTAGALIGTFKADITVPAGSIENVTSQNHVSVETMCEYGDATASARAVQSCGQRRANVIRLSAATIAPNRALRVLLVLNQDLPTNIPVSVAMKTDAGQTFSIQRGVTIDSEGQQCATEFAKQHSLTRE